MQTLLVCGVYQYESLLTEAFTWHVTTTYMHCGNYPTFVGLSVWDSPWSPD